MACALPVIASCGARSELKEVEVCAVEGEARACRDICGVGQQTCRDGAWRVCEVPEGVRPCSNACGAGTQRCSAAAWGECAVEPVVMRCSNVCGSGTQTCENGSLKECQVAEVSVECASVCGKGVKVCSAGQWRACTAPQPKPPRLISTIRDFADPYGTPPSDAAYQRHQDFQLPVSGDVVERGLVATLLGADGKPVYAPTFMSRTTSGPVAFNQWYRDTPGVNRSVIREFELMSSPEDPALYVFADNDFFPIDGELLGNQGRIHNFGFTLETSFNFRYIGGEVFRFRGDDDLWVFINQRLAIDLGGLHRLMEGSVELDRKATELQLKLGETYQLHLFFAERHTNSSNFMVETTIADPGTCD